MDTLGPKLFKSGFLAVFNLGFKKDWLDLDYCTITKSTFSNHFIHEKTITKNIFAQAQHTLLSTY